MEAEEERVELTGEPDGGDQVELATDLAILEQMLDVETSDTGKRHSLPAAQLLVIVAIGLVSTGQTRQARCWWSNARATADFAGESQSRMLPLSRE